MAANETAQLSSARRMDFRNFGIMAVPIVLLVTNTFAMHRDCHTTANSPDAKFISSAELAKVLADFTALPSFTCRIGDQPWHHLPDGLTEGFSTALS